MTIVNHWGRTVNSDEPVAGVISQNRLEWNAVEVNCTVCEKAVNEIETMTDCPDCGAKGEIKDNLFKCPECTGEIDIQEALEEIVCDDHGGLIGDWIRNEKGEYSPDKNGEFAAELTTSNFNDVIVHWSKTVKTGVALCSPCIPGAASIESEGNFTCYDLPEWAKYSPE